METGNSTVAKKGFVPARVQLKKNTAIAIGIGGAAMQTKEGDKFKNVLDGVEYAIKKIVNRMVVLESEDGKKQILTEVDNLRISSLYQKMRWNET